MCPPTRPGPYLSDVEGSTRLWERYPEATQGALARLDAILRAAVEGCGGTVVKTTGRRSRGYRHARG